MLASSSRFFSSFSRSSLLFPVISSIRTILPSIIWKNTVCKTRQMVVMRNHHERLLFSCTTCCISSITSLDVLESRFPVGSSAKMISGSTTECPRHADSLLLSAGHLSRPVILYLPSFTRSRSADAFLTALPYPHPEMSMAAPRFPALSSSKAG